MGTIVTAGDLAELRGMTEAELDDRCVIKRRNPAGDTRDPDTGRLIEAYTTVYDSVDNPGDGGPCRFRMTTSIGVNPAADRNVAEQQITITQVLLQLPTSAVGVTTDDVVVPQLSLDPEIPDHDFRIDGPYPGQTHGVCRRYWLEEIS